LIFEGSVLLSIFESITARSDICYQMFKCYLHLFDFKEDI
jgi:hypothetical protein